ncbi:MAG: peptidylprolyl isomerase [Planctomycetales bacterium]|nr:peptidylprolyl isomerase [Planctomycetales bacterium]
MRKRDHQASNWIVDFVSRDGLQVSLSVLVSVLLPANLLAQRRLIPGDGQLQVSSLPPPPAVVPGSTLPNESLLAGTQSDAQIAIQGQSSAKSQNTIFNATSPVPPKQPDAGPTINDRSIPTELSIPPLPQLHNAAQASGNSTASTLLQTSQKAPSGQGTTVRQVSHALMVDALFETEESSPSKEFGAGELIAVVGDEHILAGDMWSIVEPILEENKDRISESQYDEARRSLTRRVLTQYIEIKAMYQEFIRETAGSNSPKEIEEMKRNISTRAGKLFFDRQVPVLCQRYGIEDQSIAKLEEKLREKSLSLLTMRSQFIEQALASELERKIPESFEISRDELWAEYKKNEQRWNIPARARWRQLSASFSGRTRSEADQMIRRMGDEIFLGGAPFEAVAKANSEGLTAQDGGKYDWTSVGSLKSKALEQAIFTLPLGELSGIIEDELGFHIIEVLERENGHIRNFADAQADLRQELSDRRRAEEVRKFREQILRRTPIWTLWPEDLQDIPGVTPRPLTQATSG